MRRLLLAFALALALATPARAGRLATIGFELGSATAGLGDCAAVAGSPAVDGTAAQTGSYGLHISSLSSGAQQGCRVSYRTNSVATQLLRVRFYLRVATLPGASGSGVACLSAHNNNTCIFGLRLASTGAIVVVDEDGTVGTSSQTLSTATWYRIEFLVDGGADATTADDDVELLIDGASTGVSVTNRDIDSSFGSVMFGGNLTGEANTTGEWYIDDAAANDASGSAQTGYPGAGRIVLLRVDGDGTATWRGTQGASSDWDTCTDNTATCGAGTGGTAYQSVDEAPPADDLTTHLRLVGTSASCTDAPVLLFTLTSATAAGIDGNDDITLVGIRVRTSSDAAGGRRHVALLYSATTCAESAEVTIASSAYAWDTAGTPPTAQLIAYADPATTAAWTLSALDALEAGVRSGADASPQPQVTLIAAEVEYVADDTPIGGGDRRGRALLGLTGR